MNVGDEVRTVTITRTVTATAQDLALAAGLPEPDKWAFADGHPDATATLSRTE